jgi:hypothetical protein
LVNPELQVLFLGLIILLSHADRPTLFLMYSQNTSKQIQFMGFTPKLKEEEINLKHFQKLTVPLSCNSQHPRLEERSLLRKRFVKAVRSNPPNLDSLDLLCPDKNTEPNITSGMIREVYPRRSAAGLVGGILAVFALYMSAISRGTTKVGRFVVIVYMTTLISLLDFEDLI